MLNIFTLAVLSVTVLGPGSSTINAAGQERGCPAETEQARATLARFLTGPLHAEERERYGIPQIAPGQARVLTDRTDAEVCAALNRGFAPVKYSRDPYRLAYFAAHGYYFATITTERAPGGPLVAGHYPPVLVFDTQLRPVNASPAQH